MSQQRHFSAFSITHPFFPVKRMIFNFFKIALRSLRRHALYGSINIVGLSIGLAACALMAMYVRHELSYDVFHQKAQRILRVTSHLKTPEAPMELANTPNILAPFLNRNYPEVEKAVRFQSMAATFSQGTKLYNESDVYYADASVFDVFTFPLVAGDARQALTQPQTVVLTETLAKKYFGTTDVLGKTVQINKQPYQITGVMAELPTNTDLKIRALLSHDFDKGNSWIEDLSAYTFVLFRGKPDNTAFEKKMAAISRRYIQPELTKMDSEDYSLELRAEALTDVHYSQGKLEDTPKGNKQYGYLFSFLAVFVLVIALLNYISLLTARATERAKEVGVRKANGALRSQLIWQFLFESLLISSFSVVIGLVILQLVIPLMNDLLQTQFQMTGIELGVWAGIGLAITTLLGGLYPAFVLSAFRPAEALRGGVHQASGGFQLRQTITVFQFMLAVGMIAGVLVMYKQMDFLQNHSLGFNKNKVLTIQLPADSLAQMKGYALAASLKKYPAISEITAGSGFEPASLASTDFTVNGKAREVMTLFFFVDDHYLPTLELKLAQGRNFSSAHPSDKRSGFIVNEAFVKMSGWKQPIGQPIEGVNKKGTVIGVVKNFHFKSLHNLVEPMAMVWNVNPPNTLMLKTSPEQLPLLRAVWQKHYPFEPFEYSFLDSTLEKEYQKDRLTMTLFNAFAFLTIFVSCLGLFSLVTFSTELRTKEIGIRKVLGASVVGILTLLSKDFLKLVALAIVIASPLAYYALNRWLESFAYHITISGWTFVWVSLIAIVIALVTISFQSVKAALVNPVKSLKSE